MKSSTSNATVTSTEAIDLNFVQRYGIYSIIFGKFLVRNGRSKYFIVCGVLTGDCKNNIAGSGRVLKEGQGTSL